MIGAGMAMFGVFGDMFGCLADAGKAVNALSDTAQNAQRVSDAVKSTEALFGIASIGAMGVATATSGAELFPKSAKRAGLKKIRLYCSNGFSQMCVPL